MDISKTIFTTSLNGCSSPRGVAQCPSMRLVVQQRTVGGFLWVQYIHIRSILVILNHSKTSHSTSINVAKAPKPSIHPSTSPFLVQFRCTYAFPTPASTTNGRTSTTDVHLAVTGQPCTRTCQLHSVYHIVCAEDPHDWLIEFDEAAPNAICHFDPNRTASQAVHPLYFHPLIHDTKRRMWSSRATRPSIPRCRVFLELSAAVFRSLSAADDCSFKVLPYAGTLCVPLF